MTLSTQNSMEYYSRLFPSKIRSCSYCCVLPLLVQTLTFGHRCHGVAACCFRLVSNLTFGRAAGPHAVPSSTTCTLRHQWPHTYTPWGAVLFIFNQVMFFRLSDASALSRPCRFPCSTTSSFSPRQLTVPVRKRVGTHQGNEPTCTCLENSRPVTSHFAEPPWTDVWPQEWNWYAPAYLY